MADAFIIAMAVVAVVVISRPARPVNLSTSWLLVVISGAWIWANLRSSGWEAECGDVSPPDELDFITRGMFYRGWPASPCMICMFHGMRFRPSGNEGLTLVFDWGLLVLALTLTRFLSEFILRRRAALKPRRVDVIDETAAN